MTQPWHLIGMVLPEKDGGEVREVSRGHGWESWDDGGLSR